MKYIEAIYDCETQTDTFVEREYTKEQLDAQKEFIAARKLADNKDVERNALLEKLGITEDEARLLLG